ncbi:hypothetical protein [Mycolicibacterium pallens]|uniref:Uncharacterized protein n=1 Tax=Mycolicibacterium pallens TaxID=370524 RepID=A0ABX8VBW4_9MYCO|nr:hypothetical protein [Mycolicibacterium pallens]QYL14568.1 hypothetical protein K0O64_15240 [Mycolicibacterium pallens]
MAERRDIVGLPNWSVNSDGIVRHHWKIQPITNQLAGLPTVDLTADYLGPIPSPGCVEDCPRCLWMNDSHMGKNAAPIRFLGDPTGRPAAHKYSTLRLLDEVVLLAFDRPPGNWRTARPYYIDGSPWKAPGVPNCRADNLKWWEDVQAAKDIEFINFKRQQGLRGAA